MGKDLISALKFEHLETESRSDVWFRRRQTFLARTYRVFRNHREWCLHHSCPKRPGYVGLQALSYRCCARSCALPLVMLSCSTAVNTFPQGEHLSSLISVETLSPVKPSYPFLFLLQKMLLHLEWARNSHILSLLGVYV